jgi:protein-L-isoaspartate O-methyltransferase
MPAFFKARDEMTRRHLARYSSRDRQVSTAMRAAPRGAFVDPGCEECAYEARPLPIGEGPTMSQPYIVAPMIQAADMTPGEHVLEVRAGSAYAAAVLSRIADQVSAIGRYPASAP